MSTPPLPLSSHISNILFPPSFLYASLVHLPPTIFSSPRLLLSPRRLQSEWFASFWAIAGPGVREAAQVRVVPLLEGRIRAGAEVHLDSDYPEEREHLGLPPPVGGVVVEIGPGSGMWLDLLASLKRRGEGEGGRRIEKVLGIEPNAGSRAALARRIDDLKAGEWYYPIPSGVDDVVGIEPESVDSIVCVLVLCSVPDPATSAKNLYKLLKPGGSMYVYEHVRIGDRGGWGMAIWQRIVNLFWPHMVGGCTLCRPTERYLREAGLWTKIDLQQPPDEPWSHTLPHIIGTLTK